MGRTEATVRESVGCLVKRIPRRYGYPPDLRVTAGQTVLQQAEVLAARWATA